MPATKIFIDFLKSISRISSNEKSMKMAESFTFFFKKNRIFGTIEIVENFVALKLIELVSRSRLFFFIAALQSYRKCP